MSFIIGDTIPDIQLETQTVGVRISNPDIILSYKRADEYFGTNYKMPTTEELYSLLVFSGIYEYSAPLDFAGWSEPQRPYGYNSPWFVNTTANELTHSYVGNQTAFRFARENQYLMVSYNCNGGEGDNQYGNGNGGSNTEINGCDSLTQNGTVTVSGDGSNLIVDNQIYVENGASLRFTIAANTGSTVLTFNNMNQVDLTNYAQYGYIFLNINCPDTNTIPLSNVTLQIGSDASNYYQISSSTRYRGDSILANWGAIGFNMLNATIVGAPVVTNITWMQVTITNGTNALVNGNYRIDAIFAALGTYFQLPYYSKYNIKNTAGVYIPYPTAITDMILCPDDCNAAYFYRCLSYLAFYNLRDQGLSAAFATRGLPFENALKIKYPSQERHMQSQYYRSPRRF